MRFLIIYACIFVVIHTVSSSTVSPSERTEMFSGKSLQVFVKYAKKISSISLNPGRGQNLLKFMEIHDELLDLFLKTDSELEATMIKALMEHLKQHMKFNALLRYRWLHMDYRF